MFTKDLLDKNEPLRKKWEDEVKRSIAKHADQKEKWTTVSDLDIKRIYGPDDIKDMNFETDIAYPGQFPFCGAISQPVTGGNIGRFACFPVWVPLSKPMSGGIICYQPARPV